MPDDAATQGSDGVMTKRSSLVENHRPIGLRALAAACVTRPKYRPRDPEDDVQANNLPQGFHWPHED